MNEHEKINYVEFPAKNIDVAKTFFSAVFNWSFTDHGAEYSAFKNAGLNGGFYQSGHCSSSQDGAPLIVFYSQELMQTQKKIIAAQGKIVKPVFSFPGGQRFHFTDPNGNEYAVWSDK